MRGMLPLRILSVLYTAGGKVIRNYVAFDLETTGLDCEKDEIIEIGALKVIDGKVKERFIHFICPQRAISPEITRLTGITNAMVEGAPKADGVIPEFLDFCGDEVLIGHNIMFDFKFMKAGAAKLNLPFDKTGIDTLRIAKAVHADLESRSLESLCGHYQIVNASAHRAYHDALATAKIYQLMAHYYETAFPDVFKPVPLCWRVKKTQPMTAKQKAFLTELIRYHQIEFDGDMGAMTKSEASRAIDKIILQYGRMV